MRVGFWVAMLVVGFGVSGCVYVPPGSHNPGYYAPAAAVAPAPVYVTPRPYYYRPHHYYGR